MCASSARPEQATAMRPSALLALIPAIAQAMLLTATLDDGRNVTVHATMAGNSPIATPPGRGLDLAFGGDACASMPRLPAVRAFVLYVRLGGCSMETKMAAAIHTGAVALIVADSLATQYAPLPNTTAASMALGDPCIVDCRAGRGEVATRELSVRSVLAGLPGRCPAPILYDGKECPTSLCAFSGAAQLNQPVREVCCVLQGRPTAFSAVSNATAADALPTLLLSRAQGHALEEALGETLGEAAAAEQKALGHQLALPRLSGATVWMREQPLAAPRWDGSSLLVWLIATGTAAFAAFHAAGVQHGQELEGSTHGGDGDDGVHADIEVATLDYSTAVGFLGLASFGLLSLYFLVQAGFHAIVLIINIVFVFAAATAMSQILTTPALSMIAPPSLLEPGVRIPFFTPMEADADELPSIVDLSAGLLAFGAAVGWFVNRKSLWMWAVQDLLAMCVCVLFVRTLRLPSLRVGALFLGLMFFYDIFMVFLSPYIFPSSVMLTVATAGASRESIGANGTCQRTEGETIPMLMAFPRLSPYGPIQAAFYSPPLLSPPPPLTAGSPGLEPGLAPAFEPGMEPGSLWWRLSGAPGDFSMIGLGDIVLPALAIAYARRVDLIGEGAADCAADRAARPCTWCGYFTWSVVGYAIGLAVTLAANVYGWTIHDVRGQPALLYLVPGVIGSQVLRALLYCDLRQHWEGSRLPQPDPNVSSLQCDGCRKVMLHDCTVWSEAADNVDYCPACYAKLSPEKQAPLVEVGVHIRCGVLLPASPAPTRTRGEATLV